MRAAIIAMMILLLLPAALFAGATMGVYFTYVPGTMVWNPDGYPVPATIEAYVYAHNSACFLNGAEFALELPPGIILSGYALPVGILQLGSLPAGISMAIWPPMDGWNPGYNLLCSMTLVALRGCACYGHGGDMSNLPLRVIGHIDTGLVQGSCWPEGSLFEYAGLTSILCLDPVGVQETNWGAIKSLF